MTLKWSGKGINEFALYKNKKIIKLDPYYFRPSEVDNLLGDPSKAKKNWNCHPKISFDELVEEMIKHDLKKFKK